MGTACRILSIIYGIIGAIGAFVTSNRIHKTTDNWGITIAVFFAVVLSVAMVTVALYTIGEIYDGLTYSFWGTACRTLAIIYGIIGVIGAFISARTTNNTSGFGMACVVFFGVVFVVAMVVVGLYTLGEIYETVNKTYVAASQSSKINALAQETVSSKSKRETEEKRKLSSGGWKCPDCGKMNNSYETTCSCGRRKNDKK